MMGFRFMENFNYPYISKSVSEFWRRWHISLSTWFREYVFYPMERSRRKFKFMLQPVNFLIVFLLVGLWHGIAINFIIWGGVHGIALAFESSTFGRSMKKAWAPIQHAYTLVVVLIGWVFFRSPTLAYAIDFLARLAGSGKGISQLPFSVTRPLPFIDPSVWLAFIIGLIFSLPIVPGLRQVWVQFMEKNPIRSLVGSIGADLFLLTFLILSIAAIITRATLITSVYAKF
jgi:alginate O-acetyltransferase complex protein AlgI